MMVAAALKLPRLVEYLVCIFTTHICFSPLRKIFEGKSLCFFSTTSVFSLLPSFSPFLLAAETLSSFARNYYTL